MKQSQLLFQKIKYELSVFAALSINFLLFFTKEDLMSDIIYPMHLVDVKAGLISRTLVGSITGLLWEHPTKANVFCLHLIVVIISFMLTAVFLGKCIKPAEEKSGKQLFFISLIVAVFPYGFMSFINLFELLDIYWLLAVSICLLAGENKASVCLIPLFIILGGWAHYSFVLAFMPVIYILFLNMCIKEKSRFSYIITGIMILVSVSSTIYFFSTSRTFNVISFDEFTQYILNKAGDKITQFEIYCGEAFRPYDEISYDYYLEKYSLPEWIRDASDLARAFYGYFVFTFIDGSVSGLIADFILVSPLTAFFVIIWKKAMSITQDKAEKFTYFLCLITPLVQVFACFTSSDTSRWLSLLVISQLFLLALFIKEKAKPVTEALDGIMTFLSKYKTVFIFVVLFYLSIVFVW